MSAKWSQLQIVPHGKTITLELAKNFVKQARSTTITDSSALPLM